MDNVHDLGTRREAKIEMQKSADEPNPLLSARRITLISNPPVRVTVAYLLFRLGANPRTFALEDTTNMAGYEIHQTLIHDHCASIDDYITRVGKIMFQLTGTLPKYLVWSSNSKTGVITVAYIR